MISGDSAASYDGMTDIHCHLLPGIDDGPRNWEQSIELCRAMADDGITRAVATPHLIDGVYNNTLSLVTPLTAQLNERLGNTGIKLEVLTGAEVDLASRYAQGSPELPTLAGGKAVLLEMPMAVLPQAMEEILFSVTSQDLIPVLAHPERNEPLQDNPRLAADWLRAGAVLQVDGDSLLGVWGRGAERLAIKLLERGLAQAMASDAHSVKRRPPRLAEARQRATELVGEQAAALLTNSGPQELLASRVLTVPVYSPGQHDSDASAAAGNGRGWLGRLLGR